MFEPDKVNVPESTFFKAPFPDITPLSANDPPLTTSKVPPVEPSTTDFVLNVPPVLVNINEPLLKNNEPEVPRFCVPANANVPAFKLSGPVNVLTPLNVSTLAPAWVSEPAPESTPPKVPLVVVLKVSEPALLMFPVYETVFNELATINAPTEAIVREPVKAFEPPTVNVPAETNKLPAPAMTLAKLPPYKSVLLNASHEPALMVTLLAIAPLVPPAPIWSVPPLMVVAPV